MAFIPLLLILGNTVITWYKGDRIVSAGLLRILTDPRYHVASIPGHGVSLSIRKVTVADQGEYSCEANYIEKPISVRHRLEVLSKCAILREIIFCLYGEDARERDSVHFCT